MKHGCILHEHSEGFLVRYPSEQQFYNAMRKKGWDPNVEDTPATVAVHNTINEHTWKEVLKYEQMHSR